MVQASSLHITSVPTSTYIGPTPLSIAGPGRWAMPAPQCLVPCANIPTTPESDTRKPTSSTAAIYEGSKTRWALYPPPRNNLSRTAQNGPVYCRLWRFVLR